MNLLFLPNDLIKTVLENIGDKNNLFSTVNKNWYEKYTRKFTKKTYIYKSIISKELFKWSKIYGKIYRLLAKECNLTYFKSFHQNKISDNFEDIVTWVILNNNLSSLKYYCENIKNYRENIIKTSLSINDDRRDLEDMCMGALSRDNLDCFKYLFKLYVNFIENDKIKEYYKVCKEYHCTKSGDYLLETYPNECTKIKI